MLSPAGVVVLCVLASTFACPRAFYLSANVLTFQQAQQFCQQQCSSELASIHSQTEYDEILSSIQRLTPTDSDAASLWGDISRVWLGLYQYTWSDGTPLDYGDTLDSIGSYPWASDQPTALNECVQINAVDEWYGSPCTEHAHAVCNHCDGVLNHFALVTTHKMTRVEAEVACAQQYNSTLASVHNERHAQEVRMLWNVTRETSAAAATAVWIGFVWDDDTPVDYGSNSSNAVGDDPDESECAPWNATQPDNADGDEYCVWLDEASGCWSDTDCNTSLAYPICALTSEFSTTLNEWHLDAKVVATADNYLIATQGANSEAFLEDTWWHNGDAPMLIEWTFTLEVDGIQAPWTGLTIYNDPSGSNCHWYWFGVELYGGVFTFYMERGKPELQDRTIYEAALPPGTIEAGQDVTMLASITTNKETPTQPVFNVWINGEQVARDWVDIGGFHVIQSGHSGYIELQNGASARCVSKALFVSGAPMEAPEYDSYWCNEANSVPTVDPTEAPTRYPTAEDAYDSFISVNYVLSNLAVENVQQMQEDTVELGLNVQKIERMIERGYVEQKDVVIEYQDFWVQIAPLNDSAFFHDYSFSIRLNMPSIIMCTEKWCNYLISNRDDEALSLFMTAELRHYFGNNVVTEDVTFSVAFMDSTPSLLRPSQPLSTVSAQDIELIEDLNFNFFFYVPLAVIACILLCAVYAGCFNHGVCFRCPKVPGFGCHTVDDGKFRAVIVYALHLLDFFSDINLTIQILLHPDISSDRLLLGLGVASVVFVVLPYAVNLYHAANIKRYVAGNEVAKMYFERSTIFLALVVFSGGCYASIALCSSNIFGLRVFSAGLTQTEMKQLRKLRVASNTILENMPQICVQIVYATLVLGDLNSAIAFAFVASVLSVTNTLLSFFVEREQADVISGGAGKHVVWYYLVMQFQQQNVGQYSISAEQRKTIKNNKGRRNALIATLSELFSVLTQNIEIARADISKYGAILFVSHTVYASELLLMPENDASSESKSGAGSSEQTQQVSLPHLYLSRLYALHRDAVDQLFRAHFGLSNEFFVRQQFKLSAMKKGIWLVNQNESDVVDAYPQIGGTQKSDEFPDRSPQSRTVDGLSQSQDEQHREHVQLADMAPGANANGGDEKEDAAIDSGGSLESILKAEGLAAVYPILVQHQMTNEQQFLHLSDREIEDLCGEKCFNLSMPEALKFKGVIRSMWRRRQHSRYLEKRNTALLGLQQQYSGASSVKKKADESYSAPLVIDNALVLCIGVSEYKNRKNLPGVQEDVENYRELWHDVFGYDVIPNKNDGEWFDKKWWSYEDIEEFVERKRFKLLGLDQKLKYDALIITINGHGVKHGILPSDFDDNDKKNDCPVHYDFLQGLVDNGWEDGVVSTIPRVFIVDACRGGDSASITIARDDEVVHQTALMCTLYGNSPGFKVREHVVKGGEFTQCLVAELHKTKDRMIRLGDIMTETSKVLKQKTSKEQTCWIEGDPECGKIVFMKKEKT